MRLTGQSAVVRSLRDRAGRGCFFDCWEGSVERATTESAGSSGFRRPAPLAPRSGRIVASLFLIGTCASSLAVGGERATDESRATQKDFASGAVRTSADAAKRGDEVDQAARPSRSTPPKGEEIDPSQGPSPNIVGGTVAPAGAYPFFVSVKTAGDIRVLRRHARLLRLGAHRRALRRRRHDGGEPQACDRRQPAQQRGAGRHPVGHRDPPPPELEPVDLRQ